MLRAGKTNASNGGLLGEITVATRVKLCSSDQTAPKNFLLLASFIRPRLTRSEMLPILRHI